MGASFVYFPKRVGLRWEVWRRYDDGRRDPASGANEWRALWAVGFWRWLNAARTASDMQQAYISGGGFDEDLPLDECA